MTADPHVEPSAEMCAVGSGASDGSTTMRMAEPGRARLAVVGTHCASIVTAWCEDDLCEGNYTMSSQ